MSLLSTVDLTPIPRLSLANLPTQIQSLDRLSDEVGGVRFYVKRDDETGADLSGNKIRKLEFLLAEARELGADLVITCGGIQSNHCRATAIAARRSGMDSVLLLRGEEPELRDGNLFLDTLVGADIRFVNLAEYADRDALMAEIAESSRKAGRVPYIIPEGGSNATGSLGYISLLLEVARQSVPSTDLDPAGVGADKHLFPWDHIVCATGSGGTLAGLQLGARLLGLPVRIWGVPVCGSASEFQGRVMTIATEFQERYLRSVASDWEERGERLLDSSDIGFLEGYEGPAYAVPYEEELERIRDVGRKDGLLLDPVYTGKAFHGMIEEAKRGRFEPGSRVLFLHTGGVFSLFAYKRDLLGLR